MQKSRLILLSPARSWIQNGFRAAFLLCFFCSTNNNNNMQVSILLVLAVVAVAFAATPLRPVISEVFEGRINVEVQNNTHRLMGQGMVMLCKYLLTYLLCFTLPYLLHFFCPNLSICLRSLFMNFCPIL